MHVSSSNLLQIPTFLYFAVYIKGYESLWFFSDEFGFDSFRKYYYENEEAKGYAKEQFKVSGFMNNAVSSIDKNPISRVRNMMRNAITEKTVLPKLIVIVLDEAIAAYAAIRKINTIKGMEKVVNYLMIQYDKLIEAQKDYLPVKAKRPDYPQMVWIEAPTHINFSDRSKKFRRLYNASLQSMVMLHKNTWALFLKKGWDEEDNSVFLGGYEHRFTPAGLTSYWMAVDKTVKYVETILLKKEERKRNKGKEQTSNMEVRRQPIIPFFGKNRQNDRYHWNRPSQGGSERFKNNRY